MTSCPIISIVSELRHAHCCVSRYQSNSRSSASTTRVGGQSLNDAIYWVATFILATIVRSLVPDEVAQYISHTDCGIKYNLDVDHDISRVRQNPSLDPFGNVTYNKSEMLHSKHVFCSFGIKQQIISLLFKDLIELYEYMYMCTRSADERRTSFGA